MSFTRSISLSATIALLAACASAPSGPPPALDASADPAAVAAQYVAVANKDSLPTSGNVMINSCTVAFGKKTRASAQTQAGLFNSGTRTDGNMSYSRVEAKVSSELILEGIDNASLQTLAHQICNDARQSLTSAGYNVISPSQFEAYKTLHGNGKASPYEWKAGKSEYTVFAAPGEQIYDLRYLGATGGFASAFSAMKGTNPVQMESLLVDQTQATGVNMAFAVAFASSEGDGKKSPWALADDDDAEVSHDTRMMISGDITFLPPSAIDCWERFGKRECMPEHQSKLPKIATIAPLISGEKVYTQIYDSQSTGSKIAEGFVNVLGFATSLAGGKGSSLDMQQQSVVVDPEKYTRISRDFSHKLMEMALSLR